MRLEAIHYFLDFYLKPPDGGEPLTIPSPLWEALSSSEAEHTPEWSMRLAQVFARPLMAMLNEVGTACPPSSLLKPLASITPNARTRTQIKEVHKSLLKVAVPATDSDDPFEQFAIRVVGKVCCLWEWVHTLSGGLLGPSRTLCVPQVGGFVGGAIRLHLDVAGKEANKRALDQLVAAVAELGTSHASPA